MPADASDNDAVLARLDRLNELLFARDPAIVDEMWSGPGFRLIGSELGEVAATREDLARLLIGLFTRPARLSWQWHTRIVERHGDVAWLFAEGELLVTHADRVDRSPYRAVCVFRLDAGRWVWRLFCGSEPAAPV